MNSQNDCLREMHQLRDSTSCRTADSFNVKIPIWLIKVVSNVSNDSSKFLVKHGCE